ncbi:dUTP diphosphatase [Tetragenococcus halophilus subsp. halophilus DSM 20339]|nr:dUTP diphosphatase [Tetragenococcus halophilus subsp. halophilus DSM 20339]
MEKRGFKVVTDYKEKEIHLPQRATHHSAGYDFEAAEEVVIPSIWKQLLTRKINDNPTTEKNIKPVLVPTGIKAYMMEDEFLQLANRSSNPLKRFLLVANGVGIIDSDYYNNSENEGHIMFQFSNFGLKDRVIKKGNELAKGFSCRF